VNSSQKRLSSIAGVYLSVSKGLVVLGGIAVLFLCFYTTSDVVGRYVFNNPLPATLELTLILLTLITFLGIAHVQAIGGHMRLEFLWKRFSPRGQVILDILVILIGLFIFAIATWQGWKWFMEALATHEEMMGQWGIPSYPARLIFTIGAFSLCVQYVINLVQHVVQLFSIRQVGGE